MPVGLRRRVLVAAVLALVPVAAGCTAAEPGRGHPAAAVVQARAQKPADVWGSVQAGLLSVSAYRATGTVTFGSVDVAVDVQVSYEQGHGTFSASGVSATFDYVAPGGADTSATAPSGLFVTAPAAYWLQQGVAVADAVRYAGRPVSVPRSSTLASVVALLTNGGFESELFYDVHVPDSATVRVAPPVDGRAAWVVDFHQSANTRLVVRNSGLRLPMRLDTPSASVTFGHFGEAPRVTVPPPGGLSLPG